MARRPSPGRPPSEADWIGWGGWHSRFARVLVEARNNQFAFALIDTNGDGRALASEVAVLDDSGLWQHFESDEDSSDVGRWWTSNVVCAWGLDSRRATVVLAYGGKQHLIRADRSGRWAFIHPCDPTAAEGATPTRIK
jgi:hypothetical protein